MGKTLFSETKIVRKLELFYIFTNLLKNFWLNRRRHSHICFCTRLLYVILGRAYDENPALSMHVVGKKRAVLIV